jgi:hypothetical protein
MSIGPIHVRRQSERRTNHHPKEARPMRFMMLVKSDDRSEAGVLPDQKLLTEMGNYNESLIKAGVMLEGEGLQASSRGTRLRLARGKLTVMDGPFADAKELVGGYWVIEAKTLAEAVDWARRIPFLEGEVEIRPLYELSDLPVDPAPDSSAAAAGPARRPGTKRFVAFVKADEHSEAGAMPDQKVLADMDVLVDEWAKAGVMLGGNGLKPTSKGARVRYAGGDRTVIDGPFAESKEIIAGYTMFQVRSKQEAVELCKRWLAVHVQGSVAEGEIEVRQVTELEDFAVDPSETTDGWRQQEQRLREHLAATKRG